MPWVESECRSWQKEKNPVAGLCDSKAYMAKEKRCSGEIPVVVIFSEEVSVGGKILTHSLVKRRLRKWSSLKPAAKQEIKG
jgi:hypothetical protein